MKEIVGQKELIGKQSFLASCIEKSSLVSIIFFGPPGTGKTTIANCLANSLNYKVSILNAVTCSKGDLEDVFLTAKASSSPRVLILDEVHRLNKDKQDLLLPHLEDGTIILLGTTTANPLLSINQAIRSRTHLLEVRPLSIDEIKDGLIRAIRSPKGLDNSIDVQDEALTLIAKLAGGDMRFALNYLEASSLSFKGTPLTAEDIKRIVRVPNYLADKDENNHYDTISAFQKSIRGSDVDASLYYLAKLILSGDLDIICRRLLITAYEDIGLANPQAVDRAYNACIVAREVGFPEARIPLSLAVTDLALSPKSKSAEEAIDKALIEASKQPIEVRDYLKYTPINVREEDRYPYDMPEVWEHLQYLPNGVKGGFYSPTFTGAYEKSLNINYERLKNSQRSSSIAALRNKYKKNK